MKWTCKESPAMFSWRTQSKYILLPKRINGVWKWMQRAAWREQYYIDRDGGGGWTAESWIE